MKQLRAYFHPSFSISCHLTAIVLSYCHRTDVTFFDKPFLGGVMYVSLGLFNVLVGFMFSDTLTTSQTGSVIISRR